MLEYWSSGYYRQKAQSIRQKAQGKMFYPVRPAPWALRQPIPTHHSITPLLQYSIWGVVRFFLILLLAFAFHPPMAAAGQIEKDYRCARASFERLLKDPQKQKLRHNWIACIKEYRSVYASEPDGPRADDALMMIAHLYARLYEFSWSIQDKQQALDYYNRLLKRFPKSPYGSKAKEAIAELREEDRRDIYQEKIVAGHAPVGKVASKLKEPTLIKKPSGQKSSSKPQARLLAKVEAIRFWSSPSYTRVVIDVESEVRYAYRLLKKDPTIGKPMRLYIDLNNARIGPGLKPIVPIVDDLLSDARAAQYGPDTVRVVLDIKSIDNFKIFSLRNPFRIVVDVSSVPRKTTSKIISKKRFKHELEKPDGTVPKGALTKQLALGVKRIVIDPGHGGKDPGALGYLKGVKEKNVTLEISRRLARKIRHRLGCEAVLTRNSDIFLSLEERTAIANTKNADLFVSIHANASKSRAYHGIETFFLNLATDEDAILVAARENATSAKNISDLETILSDLMKNAKIDESSRLAGYVQQALIGKFKPRYSRIKDNGVKQAPFYVLLGAEMPSILIEVAFITNPRECRRLNSAGYQEDIADAIVRGIKRYIKEIHPATLTQAEIGRPPSETCRFFVVTSYSLQRLDQPLVGAGGRCGCIGVRNGTA